MLRKLTIQYPTKWDEQIATALYAYRTKEHVTLKASPYEILFETKLRNTDTIQFTSQLLEEERLLAMEDKRDKMHKTFNAETR